MKLRHMICVLLIAAVIAGCGEDDRADAVEAKETNSVTIGDLEYRVTMFRQLNPRVAPDQSIYQAEPPEDEAIVAAFLQVCNHGDAEATPTDDIRLENAFGTTYEPVEPEQPGPLLYEAEPVGDGDCVPRDASVAGEALPGAAVAFEVPIEDLRERPFVLEIDGDGDVARRVELDL